MYCHKCGEKATKDAIYCKKCGTKLFSEDRQPQQPQQQQSQHSQESQQQQYSQQSQQPSQLQFRSDDKAMAILSYLSILWLIPLCTSAYKNSEFVNFHFNQGAVILILSLGWGVISSILRVIFIAIFFWFPVVSGLVHAAITIVSLGIVALMIWGIVGAVKDRMDPMPIIGDIKLFK